MLSVKINNPKYPQPIWKDWYVGQKFSMSIEDLKFIEYAQLGGDEWDHFNQLQLIAERGQACNYMIEVNANTAKMLALYLLETTKQLKTPNWTEEKINNILKGYNNPKNN